jgi:hypothetical protein
MTEKKTTTVTTIETHEVWIIRKPESELSEIEVLTHDSSADLAPVSPLSEASSGSETGESDDHEERNNSSHLQNLCCWVVYEKF